MTEFVPAVDAPTVPSDLRSDRLRRRNLRSSSSEDVIVIESPNQAETSRAVRRRRRMPSPEFNSSIVDLTCCPDEVVDLTSPEIRRVEHPPLEISDEETDNTISSTIQSAPESPQPSLFCPVCLERFTQIIKAGGQIKSTICGHVFCNVCIYSAVHHNKKCPTCRKKLDQRKIHTLYLPM